MNEKNPGSMAKPLSDSAALRWFVLILTSFAMSTNYYFYDSLSPLKEVLTKELGLTSSQYGLIISTYSIPNVFFCMAVIGGIIVDKIGIRVTGMMFFFSMVIGSFLTYYGGTPYFNEGGFGHAFASSFLTQYPPAMKVMAAGFFLFGLGAETSCVVVTKAIVKWFKGRQMALALGLNLSFARLGTAAAMVVPPMLLEPEWTKAPFFAFTVIASGFVAFLVYMFFDRAFDRRAAEVRGGAAPDDVFRIADITKIITNRSYIFIVLLCVTFYSAVFPFLKYAPDLMFNKYGMDLEVAGWVVTILPFANIVFTPIFGWVCDHKGYRASLMILGSFLLIVVHLMFSLTMIHPFVPMFLLGIAFSLLPAAMWPSLAKIIEESRLGTAYGLTFSIQNIGLWVLPMLIGHVLDATNPEVVAAIKAGKEHAAYDYSATMFMLAGLGILGLVFAFLLKRADKQIGTGLELPDKAPSSA